MNFPLAKVLLATDGSKDATLAARAAVDVCEGTGAELYIVHVWQPIPTAHLGQRLSLPPFLE
jgi:nucleotide-binding universal stress UspA family protein